MELEEYHFFVSIEAKLEEILKRLDEGITVYVQRID